jgi:ATP-dependent DNA ligase
MGEVVSSIEEAAATSRTCCSGATSVDLLAVDAEDFCEWLLIERKRRLRQLIPSVATRLLYVDHVRERGRDFFRVACAHDLEGIVAKPANGRYHSDGTSTSWIKIKNPGYTQMTARHELFERPTGSRKRRPMAARRVSAVGGRSLNATFAPSTCPSSRQPP